MELIEGIVDKIFGRNKSSSLKPLEAPLFQEGQGWNYEQFRTYLQTLTRSRNFLAPIEDYPTAISLNGDWHKLLNEIRIQSNENYAMLGFKRGQQAIFLQVLPMEGLPGMVPPHVIEQSVKNARDGSSITEFLGTIHSHPRYSEPHNKIWHIPKVVTDNGSSCFSLTDIYGLLLDNSDGVNSHTSSRKLTLVAEGNENLMAIVTSRTRSTLNLFNHVSYESFAKHWYGKFGWVFQEFGSEVSGGGEIAHRKTPNSPDVWTIIKAIANRHQLALYRGHKDRPLVRSYPARV